MPYRAVDDFEEAYRATKSLLLPVALRRWLTLAVVVFFVSGVGGYVGSVPRDAWPGPQGPGVTGPGPAAVLGFALLALVIALVFAVVAAVMEFVFVRITADRTVRIRGYFGRTARKGLSLFALRVLGFVLLLAAVLFAALLVAAGGAVGVLALLVLSPGFALALVGLYAAHRLTVDFVVPVMLVEDVGVLAGWRAFWPALRSDADEYGVYLAIRALLGLVAVAVAGVGLTAVAVVLAVPFLLVGLPVVALTAALNLPALGFGVAIVGLVLFGLAVTVVGVTLVQVPISTVLRYYPLFVLADVTPTYDVVKDVRQALYREVNAADGAADADEPDPE